MLRAVEALFGLIDAGIRSFKIAASSAASSCKNGMSRASNHSRAPAGGEENFSNAPAADDHKCCMVMSDMRRRAAE